MTELRVVNTSPLIYLSRARLIHLLVDDADSILVPQAVWDEIAAGPATDRTQEHLSTIDRIVVVPDANPPRAVLAWDLGAGETAVITCAQINDGAFAVIDDLAGRRCARSFGIPLRGTLGLVLKAKQQGAIPSARKTLGQLRDVGMYLSDGVADMALREVGE